MYALVSLTFVAAMTKTPSSQTKLQLATPTGGRVFVRNSIPHSESSLIYIDMSAF